MTTTYTLGARESTLECVDAAGTPRWSLPIASIILVAEYTTNEGPWADDWFLTFVTLEDGRLYFSTCSVSAGIEEAMSILQERLGSLIPLQLLGSTEWRSRVAWPTRIAGNDYFTLTEVPAKTLAEKLKKKLLGATQEYAVSNVVRAYLEEQLRASA